VPWNLPPLVNGCPRYRNHSGSSKLYGNEAGPFHYYTSKSVDTIRGHYIPWQRLLAEVAIPT
ncbi:MAG TPA: hypothetical protein VE844_04710, partial [Gammaproteobacteria bacterium]|nr:hypothetical protein [Gammaproteobacteria bacterium]